MLAPNNLQREKRMGIIDMAGDMNDLMNMYKQMCNNPVQFLSRRFNIPQNVDAKNPNEILQYLLNSGQVSQAQVNRAMNMRNNPMIKALMNNR